MALADFGGPISSLISAGANIYSAGKASKASAREAQKNRVFQQHEYRNRHRIEVADLRLAGLNPILSATGGLGKASAPSGAQGQAFDAKAGDSIGKGLESGVRAVSAAKLLQKQADNIDADSDLKHAQAKAALANAGHSSAQESLTRSEEKKISGESTLGQFFNDEVVLPGIHAAKAARDLKDAVFHKFGRSTGVQMIKRHFTKRRK